MSELDKLLDAVMKQKEELINEQVTDADKNEMIIALREKKKTEIINEIKQEYKQQLKEEVDIETEQKLHQQKIDDLKRVFSKDGTSFLKETQKLAKNLGSNSYDELYAQLTGNGGKINITL